MTERACPSLYANTCKHVLCRLDLITHLFCQQCSAVNSMAVCAHACLWNVRAWCTQSNSTRLRAAISCTASVAMKGLHASVCEIGSRYALVVANFCMEWTANPSNSLIYTLSKIIALWAKQRSIKGCLPCLVFHGASTHLFMVIGFAGELLDLGRSGLERLSSFLQPNTKASVLGRTRPSLRCSKTIPTMQQDHPYDAARPFLQCSKTIPMMQQDQTAMQQDQDLGYIKIILS